MITLPNRKEIEGISLHFRSYTGETMTSIVLSYNLSAFIIS